MSISRLAFYHPRYWLLWIAKGLLYLLVKLPYNWQLFIGRLLGKVAFIFSRYRRRIANINLKLCFPTLSDKERKRLLKKHFESLGIAILEAGMALWMPDEKLKGLIQIEGLEYLQEALSTHRGILLLSGHFTIITISTRFFNFDFPIYCVYYKQKNKFINEQIKKICGHFILRENIRQIFNVLKTGHVVWYAADQDYGHKHSYFIPFFKIPTATITAPSRYVRHTKANVVFLSGYRLDKGKGYKIKFTPCPDFPTNDPYHAMFLYNQWLESAIREKPEQYFWIHRRFKTNPAARASFYDKL